MTNNTTSENFLTSNTQQDDIDLGKIFRFLLMQSKLIIGVVFVAFVLATTYYLTATKQYIIKSLLQYEAFNQNVFDPSQALQFASPGSSSSDISNMIALYESRTNYLKVIKDLNLNLKFEDLDDGESVDVSVTSDKNDYMKSHKLTFSFSDDKYTLLDKDSNELESSKYGEQISFAGLTISINSFNLKNNRPINMLYVSPESMYNSFKSRMVVDTLSQRNSFFRNEGLITVSYVTDDTELGKRIINYANNIFLNQRIDDEMKNQERQLTLLEKI